MLDQATRSLGGLSEVIRLAALVLLSVMFTGVGVALAMGGRPEAVIPLLLGAGAISQLQKRFVNLYRDLSGNY
ncbi:hypothetical protein [Hyphomonas sp.]|uniref:hypothetical protein n=1 Tax=Hyphomonas sp. TaxID=87 RepID=UPI0025C6F99F|nr:hypothetical protein [Hyphomonas sp.]